MPNVPLNRICVTRNCLSTGEARWDGICLACRLEAKERTSMKPENSTQFDIRPPDLPNAACVGEDPEIFYPLRYTDLLQISRAKTICQRCPVISDCLRNAIDKGEQWGVLGGMTEWERADRRRAEHLSKRRARAAEVRGA